MASLLVPDDALRAARAGPEVRPMRLMSPMSPMSLVSLSLSLSPTLTLTLTLTTKCCKVVGDRWSALLGWGNVGIDRLGILKRFDMYGGH